MTEMKTLAKNTGLLIDLSDLRVKLKRHLEVFNKCAGELSDWALVELSSTRGTNKFRIRLIPTKRLRNLVTATEALCRDGRKRDALLVHEKDPNAEVSRAHDQA